MSNFKWGFLAGAIALILSFVVGLLNGASFLNIIIRASIFGVVFFGFGFGVRVFIYTFFPEILTVMADDEEQDTLARPGSRVDITLDNANNFAMPEKYRDPDKPEEIGNIEDLAPGMLNNGSRKANASGAGIDQKQEDDYTYGVFDIQGIQDPMSEGNSQAEGKNSRAAQVFTPSFGDGDGGLGGLPDLDALAGAFLSNDSDPSPPPPADSGGPVRAPLGNKAQPLKGDFNPKELAEGLRTILIKEKQ